MPEATYVQPVAFHTINPDLLVVRDPERRWYLWMGSEDEGLIEIPAATATWMRMRPEIEDLPLPRLWFEPSALPLSACPDSTLPHQAL